MEEFEVPFTDLSRDARVLDEGRASDSARIIIDDYILGVELESVISTVLHVSIRFVEFIYLPKWEKKKNNFYFAESVKPRELARHDPYK